MVVGSSLLDGGVVPCGLTPVTSWVDPAFALYRQPWLIQPVSVVSVSGLDLMVLIVNYLLASALISGVALRRVLQLGSAVALFGVWALTSALLLGAGRNGTVVRVAVIQPGPIAVGPSLTVREAADKDPVILAHLVGDTRVAARRGAQLVIWPEKALQYWDPHVDDTAALRQLAASTGVYLVIGYTPDPKELNQATVLAPDGQFLDTYNKQHPISFQGDHSVGGPVTIAHTSFGTIAPIICYDLDYEDTARDAANLGASLLAVPSEDWSGIAEQHYTHLVFRAVENRVAAAKADTAWDSALIDPEGRILASHVTGRATDAILVANLPLGSGHSPFTSTGDWLGWLSVALTALWIVILATVTRRARSPRTPTE